MIIHDYHQENFDATKIDKANDIFLILFILKISTISPFEFETILIDLSIRLETLRNFDSLAGIMLSVHTKMRKYESKV